MRFLTIIFGVLLLTCATGCPRTTIHTMSGGEVTGDIEGTDRNYVYIVVDEPETGDDFADLRGAEPQAGTIGMRDGKRRLMRVDRRGIQDIDYPGNVMGTIGIAISVVGAAVMTAGVVDASGCSGDFCGFAHVFMTIPGAIVTTAGLFPIGIGWSLYANERAKGEPDDVPYPATPGQNRVADVHIAPFAAPNDKGGTAGLSTVVAW